MANPYETFAAGRFIAKKKAPYFRSVLLGFAPIEVPGLGTIGVTEHGVLIWDPEFIAQVTPEQMAGLFCHEILHVVLKHCARTRQAGRDPRIGNMADDLAINPTVREMGFQLPDGEHKGLFPETYGFQSGLTSDEYYELLLEKFPPQGGGSGDGESEGDDEEGEGNQQANGSGTGKEAKGKGAGGGKDADHSNPGGGPAMKPQAGGGWCGSCAGRPMPGEPKEGSQQAKEANRSEAEIERLCRAVAEEVREHAQKGRGVVPAGLARWAESFLEPPRIAWEKQLARIARMAIAWRPGAVDFRYDAPGRRQAGIGYGAGKPIMPRMRQPVPNVGVIADTSGSMSAKELGEVVRETNGIAKAIGASITFMVCDAQVHGAKKVSTWQEVAANLKGGGGTDMRPAFEQMAQMKPKPEVVVCITDGCVGDGVPDKQPPGMRVIFVGVGPHRMRPCEWGEYIECDISPKDDAAA